MFLGKVVAFLRNISFFSLFKSSFIDVEPPFSVDERRFQEHKDDIYSNGRKYVRQLAWNCKGKAAENVVDYLVEKHKELLGEAD